MNCGLTCGKAFELAQPGQVYVINRYRDTTKNLRTQFMRIIRRAGLIPWPRLFHALRASRQTELAAEFPLHCVCAWLGNTAAIAAQHYLTLRDEDFEEAAKRGTKSGTLAAQNAAQQAAAENSTKRNLSPQGQGGFQDMQQVAEACLSAPKRRLPPRGLEPLSWP